VRIPDGDLVPARRRRYSGGYGRSRRRRSRRAFAVVAVLLLAGSAVVWALQRDDGKPASLATGSPCRTPTARATPSAAALPAPAQVRVVVLNGTPRVGLAKEVAQQLTARGFVVVRQDNFPSAVSGPSVVTFAVGRQPAATVLLRQIPGARLDTRGSAPPGTVQLVLGGDFSRLATPAEVAAAGRTSTGAAIAPVATATPCAAP
jgi:hypothetical protein